MKNTSSFCGKLNFVKSEREELFRKMPSDIFGSAKEEIQSEWLSKVLIMDGSVSWGILEHVTCFACFAAIFQIWEILLYDGSFECCRKWEGHSMFAPFTSGWQQTETEPLIVAKGEVCNSSSSHSSWSCFPSLVTDFQFTEWEKSTWKVQKWAWFIWGNWSFLVHTCSRWCAFDCNRFEQCSCFVNEEKFVVGCTGSLCLGSQR